MSAPVLHIDAESRSTVDLTRTNAFVYFEDPSTDLWCAAWAFGDEEPVLWWPGDPCPPRIAEHVRAGGLIAAWNAAFERLAWRHLLTPKYGWPEPTLEQYRCVMAKGYAMGLPGRLESAAPALKLPITKDDAGKRIMLQLCKPRKPRKGEDPNGVYWHDDPEKIARLGAYCIVDVQTEQAIDRVLPPLRPAEQKIWFLDQRLNDRGVYIDKPLCLAAKAVVKDTQDILNKEMRKVTGDAVRGVSNTGELTTYGRKHGIDVTSIAKDALIELLVRDDLPPSVKRALEIRQEGGKTSVAKIDKLLLCRQADGRMRGNIQYHGAGPGRWAARGAQLQNLPRPELTGSVDTAITDLMRLDAGTLDMIYGPPLTLVSDCIRGMIAAPPGRKIIAGDYSQIEARVTAWLGGQDDVVEAFRRADRKEGPDIYIVSASGIYRANDITKTDPRRQVGKVSILSLGFAGGAGALLKMAKNYQLDILDARSAVLESASDSAIEAAEDAWLQRGRKSGVFQERWITAELIKIAWRRANPHTVSMWKACEDAALEAVQEPGVTKIAGRLRFVRAGSWLLCRLPGGRAIAFAFPSIVKTEMPWRNSDGNPVWKLAVQVWGVDSYTKKWAPYTLYGGMIFQNAVQGTARDVMAEGMERVEAAGYDMVLTVHDEIVAEADKGFGSAEDFTELMVVPPAWADGLPIAADGFEAERYRK